MCNRVSHIPELFNVMFWWTGVGGLFRECLYQGVPLIYVNWDTGI